MSRPLPDTVLIADDHAIVRTGLRAMLAKLPDVEIVGEAANGLEAIALARRFRPTLVTLDAGMEHSDGMEAYGEIRRWSPETRICLITGFTGTGIASQWLAAGVDGYLLKGGEEEEFLSAFRILLAGGRFVTPTIEAAMDTARERETLTVRERQILQMVAGGLGSPEIAERLSLSVRTVENHRMRIKTKLGVRTTGQLLAYALREGLFDTATQQSGPDQENGPD